VFGSVDELAKLKRETGCGVCIDFSHVLAREKKVDFGGLDFYLGLERMINKRRNEIREREREVGLETEARQGSEGGENEAKMISSSKFPKK